MFTDWLLKLLKRLFASEEQPGEEDCVQREYTWHLDSVHKRKLHGELTLEFSKQEVEQLRRMNPFNTYGRDGYTYDMNIRCMFDYLLHNDYTRQHVHTIAQYIKERIERAHYSELDLVQFALDFVQEPNIMYRIDEECAAIGHVKEYMRFPDEVLYDKEGDCDCKSSLMAALFHELGYGVLIMLSRDLGHAAIGVECGKGWLNYVKPQQLRRILLTYNGKRYLFCETTSDGYKVGQIRFTDSTKDFETIIEIPA